MNFDFSCTASRITLDLPHQIWEAEAADPIGRIWVTRLLHNKINFILSNYSRCYLSYFSPSYLGKYFTFIGVVAFFSGLYFAVKNRQRVVLSVAFLFPVAALFEIGPMQLREIFLFGGYIMVMLYGIYCLFTSVYFKIFSSR